MDHRRRLTTWKEISEHLGISLRTAQKLERDEGLPVHRFSENSTVFAYVDEIETWSRRRSSKKAEPPPRQRTVGRKRLRRVRVVALIIAVAVVISAFFALQTRSGPSAPVVLALESGAVLGLDRERKVLWRYSVPDLNLGFYRTGVPASTSWYFVLGGDSDDTPGRIVMILTDIGMHSHLVGLDFEGHLRWATELSVALDWDGVGLSNTYSPRLSGLLRSGTRTRVFVSVVNIPRFASRVMVVDPEDGTVVGDYCHPGHFTTYLASDFDGDGSDELLLGGINNPGPGPGYPAVVLLDVPFMAPPPRSRDIFGRPSMTTLSYLLFPRPAVKDRLGFQSLVTSVWSTSDDAVIVNVGGTHGYGFGVFYTFDRGLNLLAVQPDDEFRRSYHQHFLAGSLSEPFAPEMLEQLGHIVKFSESPNANDPRIAELFLNAPPCRSSPEPCSQFVEPR